jgi:glycosyltransferase involved in cell wall biosynthesis
VELILAQGKPHPEHIPNWTVHRFAIRRGLRWYVAPFVVPEAIGRVWRERPFDLLRVHSLRYIGPSALWARRLYRIDAPIVAHHHHLDPDRLNHVIEKPVIDGADAVVVGSEFARRQLRDELGVRTDHVSVVPYGVDAAFAPRPPRADLLARYGLAGHPVVLFFGGLKSRKNLPLLLDLWPRVAAGAPEARLLIAGGGPLLEELRGRVARLGVAATVVFTGYVPEAEKVDHFNLADVFVFPSAMEGFGLTVAEAMASGVPVVASDRGSIPELVAEGEGGFICDPGRPEAFVERLLVLLRDTALREKLAGLARGRAERLFRWERCVEGTRRVYEDAVEAWRRARTGARR